jgi:hypothetical protein
LGNVSNFEIQRLQAQEGSLNFVRSPKAAAETLINLFSAVPKDIATLDSTLNADFRYMMGDQPAPGGQDQPKQTGGGPIDLMGGGTQPTNDAPLAQPAPASDEELLGPLEAQPLGETRQALDSSAFDLVAISKLPDEEQISVISEAVERGGIQYMSQEGKDQLASYLAGMNLEELSKSPDAFGRWDSIMDMLLNDGDKQ